MKYISFNLNSVLSLAAAFLSLGVGSTYAGDANPMLSQFSKASQVLNKSLNPCQPPANIQAIVMPDMTQITLSWQQPMNSAPIMNYQVNDYRNRFLWRSIDNTQHCFTDATLPGTPGTFRYFLYSICITGRSEGVLFDVVVP